MAEGNRTKVFISYSHDSEAHRARVLELAQRFRSDGVDARIDQFINGSPPEGWPLWMERQVEEADFVLVVCTPTYKRRYDALEPPGKGLGATWEAILTRQELYERQAHNTKFVPVLFDGGESGVGPEQVIPTPLRAYTRYALPTGYHGLLRYVLRAPEVVPSRLGEPPNLAGTTSLSSSSPAVPSDSPVPALPPPAAAVAHSDAGHGHQPVVVTGASAAGGIGSGRDARTILVKVLCGLGVLVAVSGAVVLWRQSRAKLEVQRWRNALRGDDKDRAREGVQQLGRLWGSADDADVSEALVAALAHDASEVREAASHAIAAATRGETEDNAECSPVERARAISLYGNGSRGENGIVLALQNDLVKELRGKRREDPLDVSIDDSPGAGKLKSTVDAIRRGWRCLDDANLRDAYLVEAPLYDAHLRRANLRGANLCRANLIGADLRDIQYWQQIKSISGAFVDDAYARAPQGFVDWAKRNGAVIRDKRFPEVSKNEWFDQFANPQHVQSRRRRCETAQP